MAPDVRTAFDAGLNALRAAGATIETGAIEGTDAITKTYVDIVLPEAARWHGRYLDTRGPSYSPIVRERLASGREIPAVDYLNARETQQHLRREVDAALEGVDAIVLPTLPITAPPIGSTDVTLEPGGVTRQRTRGDAPQHPALQPDRAPRDLTAATGDALARGPAARRQDWRDGKALGDCGRLREDRVSADRVTPCSNRFPSPKRTPSSSRAARTSMSGPRRNLPTAIPLAPLNVPIFEPDEDTGQMTPNPDFVRVMQAAFAPDAPLLVGCQVGGRAVRAAQVLESFGFTNIAIVRGGFSGARDPLGRVVDPGWADSGLPVGKGADAGEPYQALLAKADHAK